uniref:Uncharacterized protein n=1 Tax=Romanomermis culicivorax TaxID=13658 RepID=A0A915K4W8_ROMCU
MSPYCYQGTANPFLRNKIVQIYHNAFEPVEIPCYTCDPRMIQDGRPKMWFTVDNRNSYDSYEGLILRANFTAQHIVSFLSYNCLPFIKRL